MAKHKFEIGDRVRMIAPAIHGEVPAMPVGNVYTVYKHWGTIGGRMQILVKPNNDHCQPEECFELYRVTNEERMKKRRAELCNTK